jgi:hypothetical protein
MHGGQFTAIIIVAIVMIASIFRNRARYHYRLQGGDTMNSENQRLRDEVGELRERIKVLERITVDKENSLSREIESLRDR